MNQPLEGIRVIDFSQWITGPVAARIMADWGAEVIRIEKPEGGADRFGETEVSPRFQLYNWNKKNLALDVKTPEGMKILDQLLDTADVFLTSFRPGVLNRLGLDYETMHKKHRQIVYAHVSPYGEKGPEAEITGSDQNAFWGNSGIQLDITEKGTPPLIPLPGFGETSAGCGLISGICAALYERIATGEGEKVTTSVAAHARLMNWWVMVCEQNAEHWPQTRKHPYIPTSNTYCSRDGIWFTLAIVAHEPFWPKICKWLGFEELIDNPNYNSVDATVFNSTGITEVVEQGFRKLTYEEIKNWCAENNAVVSLNYHVADNLDNPQAEACDYFTIYETRDGRQYKMPVSMAKFGDYSGNPVRNAGKCGQDTEEILGNLGYNRAEIEKLVSDEIVNISAS